jgi:hypothetical protein
MVASAGPYDGISGTMWWQQRHPVVASAGPCGGSSGTMWWYQHDPMVAAAGPCAGSSGTIWWQQRDHMVAVAVEVAIGAAAWHERRGGSCPAMAAAASTICDIEASTVGKHLR